MKRIFLLILLLGTQSLIFAQNPTSFGREVQINLNQLTQQLQNANAATDDLLPVINLPSPDGSSMLFRIKSSPVMENQVSEVKTYSGVTLDKNIPIRMAITPSGFTAIMRYNNGYYFIEPIEGKSQAYRIYNINEAPKGACNLNGDEAFLREHKNGRILSASPFPIGTQLRTFRMAAAATNKMTTALGGQTQARDKIVSVINAVNLIYEVEVAIRFTLIAKTTTSMSIILTSQASDPFVINPTFASAANAQTGFTAMHNTGANPYNGLLNYSEYDIGHVFNSYTTGSGPTYYVRGQAGPTPCEDDSKARGWTEFVSNAALGTVVDVFAHETGHQFMAWHTYNAIGGENNFCTNGWDDETAVEPGSGTTLMGYGTNCDSPVNYVLRAPNSESYFHTKSIEQILNSVNNFNTCRTLSATGNTPPTSNAGSDYTIPKGTPFTLTGSATDPNASDVLSYAWEQYDVASANDKGALGSSINGSGGYPAIRSTLSAPLFRSKISSVPIRNFPDLKFVLNNANNPPDNEGEDLPMKSRIMKFRLTVRDNKANGGGVDSDEVIITVDSTKGPLAVTAPNGGQSWAAGASNTVTWSVNNTNLLTANIKILLSIDGGYNYPFVLAASTTNDGTQSVTIPANVPNTTQARIKVVSTNSLTAEFFDVSNANFTITSTCSVATTFICPETAVSGNSGSGVFNLGLTKATGNLYLNKSKSVSLTGQSARPLIVYTDNTFSTCSVNNSWSPNSQVVAFKVTKTGSYSISAIPNDKGSTVFSIFNSSTFNCSTFIGSNGYGEISWVGSRSITLNACTTYYAVVYSFYASSTSFTLNFSGTGDIIDIQNDPAGFSYTYVAVNETTNQIQAVSASSNFTSLPGGSFIAYGLSYANGFDTNTLLNKTIEQAYALGTCMLFSSNSKQLTIIAVPCPTNIALVHPADDITSGDINKIASATNGKIAATNYVTGAGTKATYQAKAVELNAGFKAETGTIFRAETGGCN
ncbi:M12 family metallo-peptidase [Emticicia sp. C21]|uniref:M12 family metallo-peptidase n=1 Tax=Emticicia sp. C21 TaxID=2302915 RepID=UPI0013142142|nr:M12 family metallo-peptidase [Emticicia sp. C21]